MRLDRALRFALLLVPMLLCAEDAPVAPAPGEPAVSPAKLFGKTCGPCHGKDGRGSARLASLLGAAPADLTVRAVQAKTDAELEAVIMNGTGKMPAFGKRLEPAQLTAILAFIRTLGKATAGVPEQPAGDPPLSAPPVTDELPVGLGFSIFKVSCSKCHALDTHGRPELAHALALSRERIDLRDETTRNENRELLRNTILDGRGRMPGFRGRLAEPEIDAVVAYLWEP